MPPHAITVLRHRLDTAVTGLRRFAAACPGCGNPVPAGQVMCSACARR